MGGEEGPHDWHLVGRGLGGYTGHLLVLKLRNAVMEDGEGIGRQMSSRPL